MRKEDFIYIFERDLNLLKKEIADYSREADLWITADGISNSAGNLCLHLLGNLNHFIGATLGKSGYMRNRDSEFTLKNIPQKQLILEIEKAKEMIIHSLSSFNEMDFEKEYPLELIQRKWSVGHFLAHLISHFNYHLGQVNYHRRLLSSR